MLLYCSDYEAVLSSVMVHVPLELVYKSQVPENVHAGYAQYGYWPKQAV